MSDRLGERVVLHDITDSFWHCEAHEEPRIDAAVTRFLTSGETADTLLDLELVTGTTLRIRASSVLSWHLSTPASRLRGLELRKAEGDEEAEHRAELGLWGDDE